jgi:hypothetical protein
VTHIIKGVGNVEAVRINLRWRVKRAVAIHNGCMICKKKPVVFVFEDKGSCYEHKEKVEALSKKAAFIRDANMSIESDEAVENYIVKLKKRDSLRRKHR